MYRAAEARIPTKYTLCNMYLEAAKAEKMYVFSPLWNLRGGWHCVLNWGLIRTFPGNQGATLK